jgi:hypothetical protein
MPAMPSSSFRAPLAALILTACAPATPPASPPPAAGAEPAAAPVAAAAPGPDKAAIEACFAAAGAKRARFSGEPAKLVAKHVLVKYKGAKSADAKITRSREEACLRAVEARDKVRGGADFAEVVKQFSEEAGAATRDGSIGAVERKDVAKPFADAAFELSVNQVSDVVETEFGFHIILRTE